VGGTQRGKRGKAQGRLRKKNFEPEEKGNKGKWKGDKKFN